MLWAFSSTSTTGVPEVTLSRVRIQFKDMQALLVERLMSVDGAIGDDDHKGVLQEAAVEHVAGGGESGERAIDTRSPKLPTQASFVQNHSSVTDCPFSAVHWKCTMYPLAELCGETGVLVKGTGSYIVKISAEGKIAAVVLNCRSARACRVVYVSAESEAAIAAPVYGHTQPDETGRLVIYVLKAHTCMLPPTRVHMHRDIHTEHTHTTDRTMPRRCDTVSYSILACWASFLLLVSLFAGLGGLQMLPGPHVARFWWPSLNVAL